MRKRNGQAMAEFALVFPIFLALLLGLIDLGRVVWASDSLASAAREGARFAIVHGGTPLDPCPVGPPSGDAVIPVASASCPYPAPSKQAVKNAAIAAAISGGVNVIATVCYGANCSGDTDTVNADGTPADDRRGTPVTVVVTSSIPLTSASLMGLGPFTVTGSSTMLVNH